MLALTLVVIAGLGVIRLTRHPLPSSPALDAFLTTGAPFVLIGVLLGPGLGVFDAPGMRLLTPLMALGIGWIGATFGARLEWRMLRRITIRTWLIGAALAIPVLAASAFTAWKLGLAVPPLGTAWGRPLFPAALLLAGAATTAASWPGPRLGRRNALIDTAFGTAAAALALALYNPHHAVRSLILTVAAAGGLAWLFVAFTRSQPESSERRLAVPLIAVLLAGSGFSYGMALSPFVVCTLMTAVIVSTASAAVRQAVQRLLRSWEFSLYAPFLIVAGALLRPSTVWLLAAAVLLAAVRVIVRAVTVRFGVDQVDPVWRSQPYPKPREFAFPVLRQGPAAVALAAGFDLVRDAAGGGGGGGAGGGGNGGSGAMLTTVLLSVLAIDAFVALTPLTASARRAEVT